MWKCVFLQLGLVFTHQKKAWRTISFGTVALSLWTLSQQQRSDFMYKNSNYQSSKISSSSSKDNFLKPFFKVLDDFIFSFVQFLQPIQLGVGSINFFYQAQYFFSICIFGLPLLGRFLFFLMDRPLILLFILGSSRTCSFSCILRQTSLIRGSFETKHQLIKQLFNDTRSGIGYQLNCWFGKQNREFLEDFCVEGAPIIDLFGGGACRWIVMKVDQFGIVMIDEFGHHDSV